MEIRIAEDRWTAEILFSPQSEIDKLMHCSVIVVAKSQDDALAGAQYVLDLFAKGRDAWIRTVPEVVQETCFDTKETQIRGFVRSSFALKAGDWFYPTPHAAVDRGLAGVST